MRANSSIPSLVVVVLISMCGCTPAEDQTVVLAPADPLEPPKAPETVAHTVDELLHRVEVVPSGPSQDVVERIREGAAVDRDAPRMPDQPIATPSVDRLIYQCSGEVTFAVRATGDRLQAFPPGFSNGFIVLEGAPTDDGVRYVGHDAEFRAKGDLATLRVGPARYVDCVSNPAAAVWQAPHRPR